MSAFWRKQSVSTHLDETMGQDVLQKPVNEVFSEKNSDPLLLAFRILKLKRHLASIQAEDSAVADGNAENVRCKVAKRTLAGTDSKHINDPGLFPDSCTKAL